MQTPRRTATLVAIALLWISLTRAQPEFEQTFGDAETVSIATGRPQSVQTAPAVASVITAEDIRNTGARDLVDILKLVPGIYIGQTANAFGPAVAVRGFTSAFNQTTLFMLDGIPQSELVFGDRFTALGKIPLDSIERVEVIRGPGSALYGADAYSAVVNIITRREVPGRDNWSSAAAPTTPATSGRWPVGAGATSRSRARWSTSRPTVTHRLSRSISKPASTRCLVPAPRWHPERPKLIARSSAPSSTSPARKPR